MRKVKVLAISFLLVALTVAMVGCDMGDDNDVEPTYYDLTIEIEGEGAILYEDGEELLTEADGSETIKVEENTSVTLKAESADNWEFVEWTGDETSTEAEITAIMDTDKSLTAVFAEEEADPADVSGELEYDVPMPGLWVVVGGEIEVTGAVEALLFDDDEVGSMIGDDLTLLLDTDEDYIWEDDGVIYVEGAELELFLNAGEIEDDTLTITALDDQGDLIDTFEVDLMPED